MFLVVSLLYLLSIMGYSVRHGFGYAMLFCLPKILPITFMGLYLIKKSSHVLNLFGYITLIIAVVAVPFFLVSQYIQVPMATFFQEYNWYYPAIIEWAFCFALTWIICFFKTKQSFLSTLFASQVIVIGGFLYELPTSNFLLNTGLYYSSFYPFFIATIWFCCIFLICLLKEQSWKPTKIFGVLLGIYFCYAVFYVFYPYFNIWIPRLPTILLI
jgi:hypothetical protein